MTLPIGLLVIALTIYAVIRKVDVRLALFLGALALGIVVGKPQLIVQKFFSTLVSAQFVIPLCCAIGFAWTLRHTHCDQHLVHLLTEPLRRVRALLIPGAVVAGFMINIPLVSQASSAVAIGPVLVPLLLAARISPLTAGAALLLGCSIGGELLNPGAPEFRTVIRESNLLGLPLTGAHCVQAALPFNLINLAIATTLFWILSSRAEAAYAREMSKKELLEPEVAVPDFKINLVKALVPLLPVALLFLTAPPFKLFSIPVPWLVGAKEALNPELAQELFDTRLIGLAMLIGTAAATLTDWREAAGSTIAFFEGAGWAMTHPIAIIVCAACFGEGAKSIGLDKAVAGIIAGLPHLLLPSAGTLPMGFSWISGSGMAATQSLYGFFAGPAAKLHVSLAHVGAIVSIAAAAGRTMSPVAAVNLLCSSLTETRPVELARRVAIPLLISITVTIIASMLMLR